MDDEISRGVVPHHRRTPFTACTFIYSKNPQPKWLHPKQLVVVVVGAVIGWIHSRQTKFVC